MLAIIVEEKDCVALLEVLELAKFTNRPCDPEAHRVMERYGMSQEDYQAIVRDIHRTFHYRVSEWLRSQGSRCAR